MAVIWGLDLHEMQWSKFKSSYMFKNREYHLRRTKFIVYQCAMIFCVVSESLGTAVLSDYMDQQDELQKLFPGIGVYNNDYIGIASYNIFVGIAVATIFGAAFFFDLFWPSRHESRDVQIAWRASAVCVTVAALGDAIAYTVIICLHRERISNIREDNAALDSFLQETHVKTPLRYRSSGRAIASLVLLWLGWVSCVVSTYVMFAFYRHVKEYGTAIAIHAMGLKDEKNGPLTPEPSETVADGAAKHHSSTGSRTENESAQDAPASSVALPEPRQHYEVIFEHV